MSLNRYARRRDKNEPAIVRALEKAGWLVAKIDRPCDLVCARDGQVRLVEIKNPERAKKGKGGDLRTPGQKAQAPKWEGYITTVWTPGQAVMALDPEGRFE